jgi:hypothetical protein
MADRGSTLTPPTYVATQLPSAAGGAQANVVASLVAGTDAAVDWTKVHVAASLTADASTVTGRARVDIAATVIAGTSAAIDWSEVDIAAAVITGAAAYAAAVVSTGRIGAGHAGANAERAYCQCRGRGERPFAKVRAVMTCPHE